VSRPRSWCWSGTVTSRSRTAACRITSVARSQTGAACCRRRRAPETYASLTLQVNSPRWAGVPFTLRSGKALAADSAEIAIHFRPLPRYLPGQWPGVEPNVLRMGLSEPYVRLSTTLNGPERTAGIRRLEARPAPPRFTACAHLILDMLNSDPMLFIRGDEAGEAWRIIDPVMNAWTAGDVPCRNTQPAKRTMRSGLRKGRSPGPTR
jgi:glucose-6-phosphate 1-dehydrogenase